MSLTERINRPDRREPSNVVPLVERRGGEDRRQPRWVERMQEGQLAAKDLTQERAA